MLAKKKHTTVAQLNNIDLSNLPATEGMEKERLVTVRVNQSLLRKIVLTNFNNQCCITGLNFPELLVASHISPWSQDRHNRLNPKNGLALNSLHDKAFDCGLITITEDLKVKVSSSFLKYSGLISIQHNFIDYDGKEILESKKFSPGKDFLKKYHERFKI